MGKVADNVNVLNDRAVHLRIVKVNFMLCMCYHNKKKYIFLNGIIQNTYNDNNYLWSIYGNNYL